MELIQGVVIRVRTDGRAEAVALLSTLTETGKAGATAGQGLGQASAGVKATGAAAKEANPQLAAMQGHLNTLMKWALPAGVVAGITMIGKRAIDTADQMAQLSKRTGVTVEDMSRLSYAAKLADTNVEAVSTGFRMMARTVTEANEGNKDLQRSFAAVGLSVEDLKSKDPTQLFLAIATGVAGIEDPTTRAAKAQELMGRSASELIPLMQDLAGDGFAKVSAEAERMGMVISTQTAQASEELNDNLDRLKAVGSGLALTVLRETVPALVVLTSTLDGVSKSAEESREDLDDWTTYLTSLTPTLTAAATGFREIAAGVELIAKVLWVVNERQFTFSNLLKSPAQNAREMKAQLLAIWTDYTRKIEELGKRGADALLGGGGSTSAPGSTDRDILASKATEEARRAAEAIAERTRALREELEILKASDPFQRAEIAYLHAMAAAAREATEELRAMSREKAEIQRQQQIDAEFARLLEANKSSLADVFARAPGVDQSQMLYMVDPARTAEAFATVKKLAEAQARALEDQYRSAQFVGVLTDAFTDAAMTGGKNFGQIAGQITGDVVAFAIGSLLEKLVGGNPATWKLGDAAKGQDPGRLYDKSGKMVGRGASFGWAAVQGGAALYDIYGGVAAGGSRTAGTIQGGMAGAGIGMQLGSAVPGIGTMIGGVVGAVVGLIAGAIASALARQEAQSNYKYGIPQFNRGVATLNGTRNINPAEEQQMVAQLQDVFTSTWNQFVRVMLTLPGGQMPGMPPSMGGAFQPEASQNFMKHFNEYLQNTLPREIAELFKEGMEDAFVGSGVTAEAFQQFWREAEGLDAATRGQFWMDLAEGLASLSRAQANMAAVRSQWTDDPMFGTIRSGQFQFVGGRERQGNESEFTANTRLAGENMFRIAREMVNLTGPERIAAFRALGQSIEAVTLSLQAYIEQIGETIRGLSRTFADERTAKQLERAGSNTERSGILWANYNANLAAIGMATDPTEIDRLTRRNIALLNEIYALDPSAEMYAWWQRQMTALEEASRTALEKIAADAVSQVDALLTSVQPFVDWMIGVPVHIQPAWDALDSQIRGAADALRDLERAIRDATRPPGGDGGNNGNVPENPNQNPVTITVQMNGSYADRAALKRDVVAAVREAVAAVPDLLDGSY